MKTIEQDTPLLPHVVASVIVAEALSFADVPKGALTAMVDRAEEHYQSDKSFARRIRGRDGREWLYAFMRHWLAGMMVKAGTPRNTIPAPWMNGQPLTVEN